MSIAEVIRLHGRLRPNKDAIVAGEQRITYRSLDRRLDGFCAAMAALGVARGDAVAVALGDTAEHLIALLGLARLGATIVPIDHRWTAAEVSSLSHDADDRRPDPEQIAERRLQILGLRLDLLHRERPIRRERQLQRLPIERRHRRALERRLQDHLPRAAQVIHQ